MKKAYLCGCMLFQTLCLYALNRRKRQQEKKRLQILKRLERLSAIGRVSCRGPS